MNWRPLLKGKIHHRQSLPSRAVARLDNLMRIGWRVLRLGVLIQSRYLVLSGFVLEMFIMVTIYAIYYTISGECDTNNESPEKTENFFSFLNYY